MSDSCPIPTIVSRPEPKDPPVPSTAHTYIAPRIPASPRSPSASHSLLDCLYCTIFCALMGPPPRSYTIPTGPCLLLYVLMRMRAVCVPYTCGGSPGAGGCQMLITIWLTGLHGPYRPCPPRPPGVRASTSGEEGDPARVSAVGKATEYPHAAARSAKSSLFRETAVS